MQVSPCLLPGAGRGRTSTGHPVTPFGPMYPLVCPMPQSSANGAGRSSNPSQAPRAAASKCDLQVTGPITLTRHQRTSPAEHRPCPRCRSACRDRARANPIDGPATITFAHSPVASTPGTRTSAVASLPVTDAVSRIPPMATPRVAAGALFLDDAGRVLMLRTMYKDDWDIPEAMSNPASHPAPPPFARSAKNSASPHR